jgi:3-ketosteroid 9alpha-monooxygenase subunit A
MTGESWTTLFGSGELPGGRVVEVVHDGADLLVYRTERGALRALEAWCPHMGNYMPNGLPQGNLSGRDLSTLLHGEELVCPFHDWRFDGRGRCSGLPTGQRQPARVAAGQRIMKSWHIREQDGVIQIGNERPVGQGPVADR